MVQGTHLLNQRLLNQGSYFNFESKQLNWCKFYVFHRFPSCDNTKKAMQSMHDGMEQKCSWTLCTQQKPFCSALKSITFLLTKKICSICWKLDCCSVINKFVVACPFSALNQLLFEPLNFMRKLIKYFFLSVKD